MNILFLLATLNIAAEPQLSAREDRPEVRAKFEALRQTPRVEPKAVEHTVDPDSRVTNLLVLQAVLDRSVLVYFEIGEGNEASLLAAGAVRVDRKEDIAHNTIWLGRYYRLLRLGEGAPDDITLEKFSGQPMKFDIVLRSDGRQIVLDVRRP